VQPAVRAVGELDPVHARPGGVAQLAAELDRHRAVPASVQHPHRRVDRTDACTGVELHRRQQRADTPQKPAAAATSGRRVKVDSSASAPYWLPQRSSLATITATVPPNE